MRKRSGNLSLPFGDAPLPLSFRPSQPSRAVASTQGASAEAQWRDEPRLWLCLRFPRLPLEVVAGPGDAPLAVLAGESRKPVVLLANDAAASCGVHAGMPVNAALALAPDLDSRARRRDLEQAALARLAAWAMRFTPVVSIDAGGGLLLEVASSLALFGGADALYGMAVAGAGERGHAVMAALAPTARAALWLAASGSGQRVTEGARLPAALARIPVDSLGWHPAVAGGLRRMGVTRLGECMRLPRAGLARRIGQACLQEIDEALGRRPELRPVCRQAGRFRDEIDLPAETRDSGLLLEALQILLLRLRAQLQPRQAGARILWVRLRHRAAPATLLRIGLLRPSIDVAQLRELAAIHFSAVRPPGPVTALALEADIADLAPVAGEDLLGLKLDQGERLAGLLERLRLRLGIHAVHGLKLSPEHRPERAWLPVADPVERGAGSAAPAAAGLRPLWILAEPAALARRGDAPLFHGPLVLDSGPERIEAGWWDGDDVRRDYYVARSRRGMRLWIFRERRSGRWYLHGLFG